MTNLKKNITHHLTDELLYIYAGGSKEQALNLIVSEHLHECKECSSRLLDIQDVMAEFFYDTTHDALQEKDLDKSFDVLWNTLSLDTQNEKSSEKNTAYTDKLLSPLQVYLKKAEKHLKTKNVFPGLKETVLPISGDDLKVSIMDLKPAMNIPMHTHKGVEITMILSGGFYDEHGSYNAGDVILNDKKHVHSPKVYDDENCRCLVVRYGNLYFTGGMGLIYNPIFTLLD